MRTTSLALLVALVPVASWAQERRGAYVARQAGVQLASETYRFDGRTLSAQVEIPARGITLETQTSFSARLSPVRYQAAVRGQMGPVPVQEIDAAFGDSVTWILKGGGASRPGSTRITRPYAIFHNLTFSQLAVALLRYDRGTRGTQVLDVWLPDGGRVVQLRMSLPGDSGQVEMAGVTMFVKTEAGGWLKSLTIPGQAVTVESVSPPPAAPRP